MAETTQVNYEELGAIIKVFSAASETIADMENQTRSQMGTIRPSWVGRGSEAFFEEMDSDVLPGVNRLKEALEQSASSIERIMQIFSEGEEEASHSFNTESA